MARSLRLILIPACLIRKKELRRLEASKAPCRVEKRYWQPLNFEKRVTVLVVSECSFSVSKDLKR
jgi:hypothetical protein